MVGGTHLLSYCAFRFVLAPSSGSVVGGSPRGPDHDDRRKRSRSRDRSPENGRGSKSRKSSDVASSSAAELADFEMLQHNLEILPCIEDLEDENFKRSTLTEIAAILCKSLKFQMEVHDSL